MHHERTNNNKNQHLQHIKLLTKILYFYGSDEFIFVAKRCKCVEDNNKSVQDFYRNYLQ